jgi:tRNA pseudouridine55 synthase
MNGFLFIDKEKGETSFDVIRSLKRVLKLPRGYKIGHCGTLDPIATGLIIVALGEATKLLEFLFGADKVYVAECEFGAVSDTYDADGKVEKVAGASPVELDVIKKVVQEKFVGEILQMPPKFSAKKVNGKRAYDLAREGKEFKLDPKKVNVYDVSFMSFEWPRMSFEVSCGSGTYVRSLVHDLGQELEVGAYMTELRRTEIGFLDEGKSRGISIEEAVKVSELEDSELNDHLKPLEDLFENYPVIDINTNDYNRLKNGGFVLNTKSVQGGQVLAKNGGKIVGVLESVRDEKFVKFRKQIKISS